VLHPAERAKLGHLPGPSGMSIWSFRPPAGPCRCGGPSKTSKATGSGS
jgi:hypothetical protein